jgi:hypothetical protein
MEEINGSVYLSMDQVENKERDVSSTEIIREFPRSSSLKNEQVQDFTKPNYWKIWIGVLIATVVFSTLIVYFIYLYSFINK